MIITERKKRLSRHLNIIICALLFLSIHQQVGANNADSVSTVYKSGTFISYQQVLVNASPAATNKVINEFLYQTKYDLDKLFTWGLKGLKLRKEKDDILVFNFKSTQYDAKKDIINAIGEVEVPNIITFPEIHVNSRMTKSYLTNGQTRVDINVLYSDAFLKKTTGVFWMKPDPKNNCCYLVLETRVQFGWFFNFFITKPMYKKIMEWRFQKLLYNMRDEAVRINKTTK